MMRTHESPTERAPSPDVIMDMIFAFQKSRVLLTAGELELFTVLGAENKTSVQVAEELGTDARATDRLMNVLCALGLLKKKEGIFSNTPFASRFFIKDKPDFMAGLIHGMYMWQTWSTLTEAVRNGRSVVAQPLNERGEGWLNTFIATMHWLACRQAPGAVALLDLTGVSRVLDVGGGSGAYSVALVRAKEGVTARVFDLPNVVPLTKRYIEREGLLDKIEIVAGDYRIDELGSGFDLVLLSAIVHIDSFDENGDLIRKAAGALNAQGQVVVQDFVMNEDRTGPTSNALFALNMLVATESGDTYTESEVRVWMEEAGLSGIVRKETDFGTDLVIGRKNASA